MSLLLLPKHYRAFGESQTIAGKHLDCLKYHGLDRTLMITIDQKRLLHDINDHNGINDHI